MRQKFGRSEALYVSRGSQMWVFRRHALALCVWLVTVLAPKPSWAWLETRTKSHLAIVDIERSGKATVQHELTIFVRGGPFQSFELSGADPDAEPMPDATVVNVGKTGASESSWPLLLQRRDDGTLRVEVDHEKGLRTGTYLFRFRYRTNLLERDLIRSMGNTVEVRWIGPRFAEGIDSARVLLRLPPNPKPPELPGSASAGPVDPADELGGVFIANLRRAPDKDEVEIVRPHVARGEPVVWRVRVEPRVFDAFAKSSAAAAEAALAPEPLHKPQRRLLWIGIAAAVALLYGCVVAFKWAAFRRACEKRGAVPRALLRLPAALRAALAGAFLAAAVLSAGEGNRPTLGGALLLCAMACAIFFATRPRSVLRGPGQWLPLSGADAFSVRRPRLPGAWLDSGTLPGFVVFVAVLLAFGAGAAVLLERSPYQALLVLLASASTLPIFCTGRGSELPPDLFAEPSKLLAWLERKLEKTGSLKVVPWARIPHGSADADELRLLVELRRPCPGLSSLEVGVEYQHGAGGAAAQPYVLVRAREGSRTLTCLPRTVTWSRGRKADERVAVLRPKLPTRNLCLALVEELSLRLTEPERSGQPESKRDKSSGSGSSTAKPGRVPSPAHAM
jgi:hypothetical protein